MSREWDVTLHETVGSWAAPSAAPLQPWSKTENYRRSFILTAVRLYNTHTV